MLDFHSTYYKLERSLAVAKYGSVNHFRKDQRYSIKNISIESAVRPLISLSVHSGTALFRVAWTVFKKDISLIDEDRLLNAFGLFEAASAVVVSG